MDGHEVLLKGAGIKGEYRFTMKDPNDIVRRYISGLGSLVHRIFSSVPYQPDKVEKLFKNYYSPSNLDGELLNVWNFKFTDGVVDYLWIDGNSVRDFESYSVRQNYYWMMGDNRDDSADSRYWGFVPEDLVIGEALVVYMSWNFGGGPRFNRIGTIIS